MQALKILIMRRWYKILIGIFAGIVLLYFAVPLPHFLADYSAVVLDKDGRILRAFLNNRQQWHFPPQKDARVSQKLKTSVLYFEDRYFDYHFGVNLVSVVRALYQNLKQGKTVRGASTLTMQVVRLMHPRPRTYFNKTLEMLQALKIEMRYSKEEILQLYLDHAPYGGNVVGYRAAALRFFRKSPDQLTWAEATLLAVLPNAPGKISPQTNPDLLKKKRDALLTALHRAGYFDAETLYLAKKESVPRKSHPFPMLAPHLARYIRERQASFVHPTTIDRDIQIRAEALVARHVSRLRQRGIHNGFALIADTKTGAVRAYVGSENFTDSHVDGIRAPRSSGSLLKPFLYALSMDAGLILPQSKIRDVPTYYGSFSPHNSSRTFQGLVSAHDALILSANVPAVRLLYEYGLVAFYERLRAAGLTTLFRTPNDYGLPLVLGGAEVTGWDMAVLFRGLGNGGVFQPLHINPADRPFEPAPLLSRGACYLVLNKLRDLSRPGIEFYWHQFQNQWPIAWKTGTSYGHRDAWAVGVSPQWTIAVWVGNFAGEGMPELTGSRCAAPLFFDLFNSLPRDPDQRWFAPPQADLIRRDVCADTGYRAAPHCPDRVSVEAPRALLKICPYHRVITVNADSTQRVCSLCWQPGEHHRVARLVYPPDVVHHLRQRGQSAGDLPPHRADCAAQADHAPVHIVYPTRNARLYLPRDFDGTVQNVVLRVTHRDKNRTLYWYLNHRYLGETNTRHVKSVALPTGQHTLEVIDEIGHRDQTRFYVSSRQG